MLVELKSILTINKVSFESASYLCPDISSREFKEEYVHVFKKYLSGRDGFYADTLCKFNDAVDLHKSSHGVEPLYVFEYLWIKSFVEFCTIQLEISQEEYLLAFTEKEFNLFGDRLEEMGDLANDDLKKSNHGGARVGAGAKKKNPTEQIRVDADLASLFKTLSDVYRSGSESQKCRLLELLLDIGVDEGEV